MTRNMIILCPKCNKHRSTLARGGKMCWDCFDQIEIDLEMYKKLLGESQKNLFMMQTSDASRHRLSDHLLDKLGDANCALMEISKEETIEGVRRIVLEIRNRLKEPIDNKKSHQALRESLLTK